MGALPVSCAAGSFLTQHCNKYFHLSVCCTLCFLSARPTFSASERCIATSPPDTTLATLIRSPLLSCELPLHASSPCSSLCCLAHPVRLPASCFTPAPTPNCLPHALPDRPRFPRISPTFPAALGRPAVRGHGPPARLHGAHNHLPNFRPHTRGVGDPQRRRHLPLDGRHLRRRRPRLRAVRLPPALAPHRCSPPPCALLCPRTTRNPPPCALLCPRTPRNPPSCALPLPSHPMQPRACAPSPALAPRATPRCVRSPLPSSHAPPALRSAQRTPRGFAPVLPLGARPLQGPAAMAAHAAALLVMAS